MSERERSSACGEPRLTKIRVDLANIVESGWPPSTAEWLWAEDIGHGLFRIDNIPIFARGISFGDVVQAHEAESHWEFDVVAGDGGHSTFRVILQRGHDLESEPTAGLWGLLQCLGATYEGYQGGPLFAMDVPPGELVTALEILKRGESLGAWEYEEGKAADSAR